MKLDEFEMREAIPEDLDQILLIHHSAFGSAEEPGLVKKLLDDPSALPILSLLGLVDGEPAGHILLTGIRFEPAIDVQGSLLGPLAVVPTFQNQGIGGKLIQESLQILTERGMDWVFVLGHESYYPRHGFRPALEQGFEPPYPILPEFSSAWMARALTPTWIAPYCGKVIPAKTFFDPRYWSA